MKLHASHSANIQVRAKVRKRGGIAFTEERKELPLNFCNFSGREAPADMDAAKDEGPICYDKARWNVPHGECNVSDDGKQRLRTVSRTFTSNGVLKVPVPGGTPAPTRRKRNSDAINMLQRTIRQVESHNKGFEKALMWKSYYKSMEYSSPSGKAGTENDHL